MVVLKYLLVILGIGLFGSAGRWWRTTCTFDRNCEDCCGDGEKRVLRAAERLD